MRRRYFIAFSLVVVTLAMITTSFPDGAAAFCVTLALSGVAIVLFRKFTAEKDFITTVFLGALLVRLAFGLFVHIFDLRNFFGGDAITYDFNGVRLLNYWTGVLPSNDPLALKAMSMSGPGWGMNYLVGTLYFLFGENILLAQSVCAVFGAATAPMVYFCSVKMFSNKRVAKFAAIAIAVFPSFVIWSSQLMKDGLIIFLLVLAMTMVLQLQEKFNYFAVLLLILAMFGILSLRFYIFYMVAFAVVGSFVVGLSSSIQSIVRRTAVLIVMGLALTYLGVIRNASVDLEKYGSLERIQVSRDDLANSADSGFGQDIDVSTTAGALSALPIGFTYLMFAPFPWDVSNFRQAITMPEVLLWWALIPLLGSGLVWAVRNRLRNALPVLMFSLMLTLAYSVFQGNVGTAYRQRTQIQVFLFIFIAVGFEIFRERREDEKLLRTIRRKHLRSRQEAGV